MRAVDWDPYNPQAHYNRREVKPECLDTGQVLIKSGLVTSQTD